MKIPFVMYLHDDEVTIEDIASYRVNADTRDLLLQIGDEFGRPFYEVQLQCVFDTDSGLVAVIRADL